MAINHHRVVEDKPQNLIANYVLQFDNFDGTIFSMETKNVKQHYTICLSQIEQVTIENNPEGVFDEAECSKVVHLYMQCGDVISVGVFEE